MDDDEAAGVGPYDFLATPFEHVPTWRAGRAGISITTSPPARGRASPVVTAAGQTALVSVKYSVPPLQAGPAFCDWSGGHSNSRRLPFWPR